jgi:hypothetical protein
VGDQDFIAISYPKGISSTNSASFKDDGIIEIYSSSDIDKSKVLYTVKGSANERFLGEKMVFRHVELSPTNVITHELFFMSKYKKAKKNSNDPEPGWNFKVGRTTLVQKKKGDTPKFFTDYDAFVSSKPPTNEAEASFAVNGEHIILLRRYEKNFETSSMCQFDQYYSGQPD